MYKLLFVCGFNTHSTQNQNDAYFVIKQFLNASQYKVDFFTYTTNERIIDVYKRLNVLTPSYDIIIGHSMGGGLIYRMMCDKLLLENQKVILLMPFVYAPQWQKMLTNIPLIDKIYIPNSLLFPSSKLFDLGNMSNNNNTLIQLHQVIDMIQWMPEIDNLPDIINNNKNVSVIFGNNDEISGIPSIISSRIINSKLVPGLHEPFNSRRFDNVFFTILENALTNRPL